MKDRIQILFAQDVPNHIDERLQIINKAIKDYMELKGYSTEHMKDNCEMVESPDAKTFYYKKDPVISVQNKLSFNQISFAIKYQLHEDLV